MLLVQFRSSQGLRRVGLVAEDGHSLHVLRATRHIYGLALEAGETEMKVERLVRDRIGDEKVDYDQVVSERRLLPPLDHPDPAHCHVTGTGLTHLGSARSRDTMHTTVNDEQARLTDSMRMFKLGLEGGKPAPKDVGVQPEWFYKGVGDSIVPPGHPLKLPPFALGGSEEAELVGLYVVGRSGRVLRVGFALGNEFSDHTMEQQNYLYLAHSKLRDCSIGPEVFVGKLPSSIRGSVRLLRSTEEVWADTFLTGEANMSHSLANLEHHHFKYRGFRRPGDVHCHFFGAATLSFSAGVTTMPGDVFEISASPFSRPLINPLVATSVYDGPVRVQAL